MVVVDVEDEKQRHYGGTYAGALNARGLLVRRSSL